MNGFMGTVVADNGGNAPAATFLKRSDLSKVNRTEFIVFMDEHSDSLTYSIFTVDWGILDRWWSHLPAARHGGSGVITYTDGHAEIHKWRSATSIYPVRYFIATRPFDALGRADFAWYRDRTGFVRR